MENQQNPASPSMAEADERATLLQRAKQVGMSHSPNIGTDTLRQKLQDFLEGRADLADGQITGVQVLSGGTAEETKEQREMRFRKEIQAEQLALVRVRVTNMNPQKADLRGEIWTTGNKYTGTVRKFIPYNADAPFHIPRMLLTLLQEQKFQQIKTVKGQDKREIRAESKLVKEFAIEILPALTDAERAALKAAQMARGDITAD